MNRKLILDFEKVSTLFLAYPEGVIECGTDYTPAITVFDELIKSLPRKLNLVVFVKSAEIKNKVERLKRNTITFINSELSSIWLRDSAGFNMGTHIVKPTFKPKYYRKFYDEAENINQYMKVIHSILGIDMEKIPLIWDGGNLVTNGEIGFITDQILVDNKKLFSQDQVTEIIRTHLGIEPIYLPTLSDDPFAHSDGYLSFINPDTLLIANYPKTWRRKDRSYIQTLKNIAKKHVSTAIDLNENPKEDKENPLEITGNYVNFLQLGKDVYLPTYNDYDNDNKAIEIVSRYAKPHKISCNNLAQFGGLLHCISFTN